MTQLFQTRNFFGAVLAALVLAAAPAFAQDLENGEAIYDTDCTDCHGATGKGDGPFVDLLPVQPRDFTTGPLAFDTDGDCAVGTAADLFDVTRQGAAAFGGDENMDGRLEGDLSDEDVADVVAFIQDEFTSQIPAVSCDLCGDEVSVGGKGKLTVKKRGKTKDKLNWDIVLEEDGTWAAIDGEDEFDGCWRASGSSGRKYDLFLSEGSVALLVDHLEGVAQAKISKKIGEMEAKKDPETRLSANKKGTKANLEMKLKLNADVKGKNQKGSYSVDVSGDL